VKVLAVGMGQVLVVIRGEVRCWAEAIGQALEWSRCWRRVWVGVDSGQGVR
jgi:hypothetical protein